MSSDTHASENQLLHRVDEVDENLAAAIIFLADELMTLASAHPVCSGACPAGPGSTCGEVEDSVTDLVQDLARALTAAKETVAHLAQRLRDPQRLSAPERTQLEQNLVDRAITLDTALQGMWNASRQLKESPLHHDAGAVIAGIFIGLVPAGTSLGDLLETLLS